MNSDGVPSPSFAGLDTVHSRCRRRNLVGGPLFAD